MPHNVGGGGIGWTPQLGGASGGSGPMVDVVAYPDGSGGSAAVVPLVGGGPITGGKSKIEVQF